MGFNFNASANNSILESVFKETTENKNAMVAKFVPMNLIDMNPDNHKIFNMRKIEHLAKIIAEDEFVGAIDVYKKPDGRYEISGGHRRFLAEQMNGKTEIRCNIMEEPDAITKAKRLIFSNLGGRDMLPMDYARSISYYKEKVLLPEKKQGKKIGSVRKVLSDEFGISESKVQMYLDLLKLIPELQEYADDPDFPYSRLWGAVNLSEENQKEIHKRILQLQEMSQDEKAVFSAEKISAIIADVKHKEELKLRRETDAKKNKENKGSNPELTHDNSQNENKHHAEDNNLPRETTHVVDEAVKEVSAVLLDDEIKTQANRLIALLKMKKNIKNVDEINRVLDDVKTQINIYKEK